MLKKIRANLRWPTGGDGNGVDRRDERPSAKGPIGAEEIGDERRTPKNAPYQVRLMTIAHIEECWQLDLRCFVDGEAYSRDTFEYLLTSSDALTYRAVSSDDGRMIGFIIGLIEPDHTGHITTICVAPEHRRRRVAREMMRRAEENFRRRAVRTVRLEVRASNEAAQRLYQELGYNIVQRLPQYYSNGGDGLLMVKSIEK